MSDSYQCTARGRYCDIRTLGKIMGKFVIFPEIFPFSLKMGELFAHFEKKWENFGKNTKFSRNFLAIFPSV